MQSNYKDEMDVENIEELLPDEEQTEATFLSSDEEDAGVEVADAEVEPQEVESEEDEEENGEAEEKEEAQENEEASNDSSEAADATETSARRSRRAQPSEREQRIAAALQEQMEQSGEEQLTFAEKRKRARAQAVESQNGADGKVTPSRRRSSARARAQERAEQREMHFETLAAWNALTASKEAKRIQYGMIQSVEEIGRGNKRRIVAIVDLLGFRALIPFENFYLNETINYTEVSSAEEVRRRQRQMLTRNIGVRTPLLIDLMQAGEDGVENAVILANRKAALQLLNERTFEGRNAPKPGDVVSATIIAISNTRGSIRVLIGGTEVSMPKYLATNRYVEKMSEMFTLNQTIDVILRSIETMADGTYNLQVDATALEREKLVPNLRKLSSNGFYIGRVVHMRQKAQTQEIIYELHLPMQNALVTAIGAPIQYVSRPLITGDQVIFRATYVSDSYAVGRIVRLV